MGALGCAGCVKDNHKEEAMVKDLQLNIKTHLANNPKLVQYFADDLAYAQKAAAAGPSGPNTQNQSNAQDIQGTSSSLSSFVANR